MRLYTVDAFATRAFEGNPAAVCLVDRPLSDAVMHAIAAEMNLSETAFAAHLDHSEWSLRWLTPEAEVDLCGHATLATAHVLWSEGFFDDPELRFHTRSGELRASRRNGAVVLDFPALESHHIPPPPGLLEALGIASARVSRSRDDLMVEVTDAEGVRAVRPDFTRLALFDCRGVIVTAPATGSGVDFVSRFFAPAVGVDEDPVTGSAHCALAPYWAARLGRSRMVGAQLSQRGGQIEVEFAGDRVALAGTAVTIFRGELAELP